MASREGLRSSAEQWREAKKRSERSGVLLSVVGLLLVAAATVPSALVAAALGSGAARYPLTGAVMALLFAPVVVALMRVGARATDRTNALMDDLERQLTGALEHAELEASRRLAQVERQEFEGRVANALEMAESEEAAVGTIERVLGAVLPETPAELLLADNSHAHLLRVARSPLAGEEALCGVDSPGHCPAARRAQVQRFADSEAFDACPHLQGRPHPRCSAVCVPVSIMGRTVGVVHVVAEPGAALPEDLIADVATLANLSGARLGLLRMMAETQTQAATDSLTGLLNRRTLENKAASLRGEGVPYAVVMADLDHFKLINDTYGHETGDRALRLFAQTLRSSARAEDLVCRRGGEEFAIVLPSCAAADALTLVEGLRGRWAKAVATAGLPGITASFGVVDALADEDLNASLARADAALLQAKHDGRDRAVLHPSDDDTAPGETVQPGAVDVPLSAALAV